MNWVVAIILAQWLQGFDTTMFWPPFSDPSGIVFANGNLLVVDSEVGETTLFDRPTFFEMTTTGVVRSTATLQSFTKEPTGIAYDEATKTIFISEDDRGGMLHTLKPGADDLFGTNDDVATSFKVRDSGIPGKDIEDVAFYDGRLYLAGGYDAVVFVLEPGPGGFDETSVLVDTISMSPMTTVEGITVGTSIYAVGKRASRIYAFDFDGGLLGEQLIPRPTRSPSGIALSPSGIFYITDRGEDNDRNPNENDGRIYAIRSELPD